MRHVALLSVAFVVAVTAQSCPSAPVTVNGNSIDLNTIGSVVFAQNQNFNNGLSMYQWGISLCSSVAWLVSGAPAGFCTSPNGYFQQFNPTSANPPSTCQAVYNTMSAAPTVNADNVVFNYKAACGTCRSNNWLSSVTVGCQQGATTLVSTGAIEVTKNADSTFSFAATVGLGSFCPGASQSTTGMSSSGTGTTPTATTTPPTNNCAKHQRKSDCFNDLTTTCYWSDTLSSCSSTFVPGYLYRPSPCLSVFGVQPQDCMGAAFNGQCAYCDNALPNYQSHCLYYDGSSVTPPAACLGSNSTAWIVPSPLSPLLASPTTIILIGVIAGLAFLLLVVLIGCSCCRAHLQNKIRRLQARCDESNFITTNLGGGGGAPVVGSYGGVPVYPQSSYTQVPMTTTTTA